MRQQELLYQIAITQIPGIGHVMAKNLISYCGSVEEVFRQKKHKLLSIPGIGEKLADNIIHFSDFEKAEKEIAFIEKHKIKPLFVLDPSYPSRLKQLADAPVMLYYLGHADLENQKIVGIVGTRKATEYGKAFVDQLVEELSETGCLILSGLALGIDVHSHKAALRHQLPTVGVVAHGLDRIYPSQHHTIAKKMVENGGLLTEFLSETKPDKENFPMRNRIVAGLCDVLVVAETNIKGGAMITADIANSYNRDIMALPGRTSDETSHGCNELIRQHKAAMITSAKDLFELMNWNTSHSQKSVQQTLTLDLNEYDRVLLQYIRQKTKAGMDDMAYELTMDSSSLSLQLLDLEFKGLIRSLPGKYFELT